ncbi:MAG: hypothetical protein J6U70_06435 [Bacteroidales bacterium]|nr:hypothetical protein [Bacteroidales bacterium]
MDDRFYQIKEATLQVQELWLAWGKEVEMNIESLTQRVAELEQEIEVLQNELSRLRTEAHRQVTGVMVESVEEAAVATESVEEAAPEVPVVSEPAPEVEDLPEEDVPTAEEEEIVADEEIVAEEEAASEVEDLPEVQEEQEEQEEMQAEEQAEAAEAVAEEVADDVAEAAEEPVREAVEVAVDAEDLPVAEGPAEADPIVPTEPDFEMEQEPELPFGANVLMEEGDLFAGVVELSTEVEPISEQEQQLSILEAAARRSQPAWKVDLAGPEVSDVRKALSLNDRIVLIRELFDNSGDALAAALDAANQATSLDEFVAKMRREHPQWDEQSPLVYRYYMIVRRKIRN